MKRRRTSPQLTEEASPRGGGRLQPTSGNSTPQEVETRANKLLPGSTSRLELEYPARVVPYSAWVGHIPFAFWIVEVLKPKLIVELGVHTGNSYCAFLQAVHSLGLEARCFGVDHWQGDEHAGFYGDEVYPELRAYHDPLYGAFSTLLRSTFDDALPYFNEQSVDLLHIDGFHTYEAVSRDFTSWFPKMSSRGVVMFHDTNVRERGFGIWRVWDEIAARFPTFDFIHSHGLGVAYVGTESPPARLAALLAQRSDAEVTGIRAYFSRLGTSVLERFELRETEERARHLEEELRKVTGALTEFQKSQAEFDQERAAYKTELEELHSKLAEASGSNAESHEHISPKASTAADKTLQESQLRILEPAGAHDWSLRVLRHHIELTMQLRRELIAVRRLRPVISHPDVRRGVGNTANVSSEEVTGA